MIEIKLTVTNEETGYGKEIRKELTEDEFRHMMKGSRKMPGAPSTAQNMMEYDNFCKETPFKGLFKLIGDYMTYAMAEDKEKFLEEKPCEE